jgi:hypothetical protein
MMKLKYETIRRRNQILTKQIFQFQILHNSPRRDSENQQQNKFVQSTHKKSPLIYIMTSELSYQL